MKGRSCGLDGFNFELCRKRISHQTVRVPEAAEWDFLHQSVGYTGDFQSWFRLLEERVKRVFNFSNDAQEKRRKKIEETGHHDSRKLPGVGKA